MSSDLIRWQKFFFPAVVLLFLIYGLEMFLSSRLESQTFDEPAHLYAGYSYWLRSDFGVNPEHPPLVKLLASLPLLLDKPAYPEPAGIWFRAESGFGGVTLMHQPGSGALLDHARVAVSVFAFLLAGLVLLAAHEMFGKRAALFALTLFVFDPLLIGHGPLITTDTGVACAIFATVYAFYRYVKRPSLMRLGVCAVLAGQIPCKPLPTFFSMLSDHGQQQPVPEQIEGPVFISSEDLVGAMWGPDQLNPYQSFLRRRPAHIIGAEILEFDGSIPVNRIAGLSHLVVANGLFRRGKVDDALAQAQQAVALYPESLDAHQTLANVYAAHHQPDDATREYQAMLHLYDTVHPEFKEAEATPANPLAPPMH